VRRGGAFHCLLVCGSVASCAVAQSRPGDPAAVASGSSDEAFRREAPPPEPRPDYLPPAVQVTTLPNGMRLIVIERHATRLVAAELVVRGGTAALSGESPAASTLMARSTTAGTTSYTEVQLFGEMNTHLIELNPHVGDSAFAVSVRAPSSWLDQALRTMHAVALEPTFPASGFEIARRQLLGAAAPDADKHELIARRNLYGSLYGPTHPYARLLQDPSLDLAKLTREDIVRVWRETMDPAGATLVVAGDVDARAVRELVGTLYGGWKPDPSLRPGAPVPPPSPGGARLVVVDRPGARQATIVYGTMVASAGSPNHAADLIVQDLIGGMRSSALATKLRDELGATWTEGVQFQTRETSGVAWWHGSVAPERTAAVLAAIEARARELRERGPSPAELAAAKGFIVRSLPHKFETNLSLAQTFREIACLELPIDYVGKTMARVSALSWDEARAAVPEPTATKVVVVGDLASLKDLLVGLGWGPIEVHDIDGRLLRILTP
jgi:zinc protease